MKRLLHVLWFVPLAIMFLTFQYGSDAPATPGELQGDPQCAFEEAASDDAVQLCGRCGDGFCAAQCGEDADSCPKDCSGSSSFEAGETAVCGRCGDGYCATSCGENATSCPKDCSGSSS